MHQQGEVSVSRFCVSYGSIINRKFAVAVIYISIILDISK